MTKIEEVAQWLAFQELLRLAPTAKMGNPVTYWQCLTPEMRATHTGMARAMFLEGGPLHEPSAEMVLSGTRISWDDRTPREMWHAMCNAAGEE